MANARARHWHRTELWGVSDRFVNGNWEVRIRISANIEIDMSWQRAPQNTKCMYIVGGATSDYRQIKFAKGMQASVPHFPALLVWIRLFCGSVVCPFGATSVNEWRRECTWRSFFQHVCVLFSCTPNAFSSSVFASLFFFFFFVSTSFF